MNIINKIAGVTIFCLEWYSFMQNFIENESFTFWALLFMAMKLKSCFKKNYSYFLLKVLTHKLRFFIAFPQGDFIAPHIWETVGRKNLIIFKGCHYSQFYMMISSGFCKNRDNEFKLGPMHLNFPRTGN